MAWRYRVRASTPATVLQTLGRARRRPDHRTSGEDLMKIITAKMVDATHGERRQPLAVPPGASLHIAIPSRRDLLSPVDFTDLRVARL